jgi:hypothetical protein
MPPLGWNGTDPGGDVVVHGDFVLPQFELLL